MRSSDSPWNDETDAELRRLYADKLSGAQIAQEISRKFGMTITRNAVIGRTHRLGMVEPKPAKRREPKAPHECPQRRTHKSFKFKSPSIAPEPLPPPKTPDVGIPISQRKTLLQLTEETCRWPIGDPGSADFFFCGGQTLTSLPYCAYHSRVAYQPPNTRRDRRPFRG